MTEPDLRYTTSEILISDIIANFIIDRRARGLSPNTIRYYRDELGIFDKWAHEHGIDQIGEVSSDILRLFFTDLADRRNKGGTHSVFRSVKACLNWFEIEEDGEYANPIRRFHVPAQKPRALPGISVGDIQRLIDSCRGDLELRDKTILRCLLDTGARAFEFVALSMGDVDLATGTVKIQRGKGDKERAVFLGANSRRSVKRYLRGRSFLNPSAPIWLNDEGDRLTKRGLRSMVERRSEKAGIRTPGLHDFRRAFALNMWRAGIDLLAISRLMGHSSTVVTQRYIAHFDSDLRDQHAKGSPVDNADL
jgi:site-specific recombinase XerD